MQHLFWISVFLMFYTYVGYPLALWLILRSKGAAQPEVVGDSASPNVSIVISARNEEQTIENRLLDILKQTYPMGSLELVIVSDGSTDGTVSKLREMVPTLESAGLNRVDIVDLADNAGKPNALNLAAQRCQGEILVMADARQTFDSNAITALVAELQDPVVGCVSGELHLIEDDEARGSGVEMGLYWKYERFIRGAESKISSVIGMTGAIYAIRKPLYSKIPEDTLIDDVLIPMNVIRQGFRAKFTSSARAFDKVSISPGQEWQRKVRTMAGNWQLVLRYPWLLSPKQNPAFISFLSHKVMRLLVPFLIVTTLLGGFILMTPFYIAAATTLLLGLSVGLLGVILPLSRNVRIVSLAFFFLVLNAAVVVGLCRYLDPRKDMLWTDAHKDQPW